ncbi:hypothetical protein BB559_004021 [Furculomyces boomerangus]|uniref:Uncharacterized protein n=2 Tax=Harpellales TaxID=61421 RepID=A0A2T9YHA8_9FUNG|nr:hypothetical protein BB559_004021 [Furculomyces boomerangus]PVZ98167.1 hypothetical protein BB558_005834 [Smittium angustum]
MEDSGAFARPGHSRGYKASTEEEDASMLRLGQDFQDSECLLISEVKILLEAQRDTKIKENKALTKQV